MFTITGKIQSGKKLGTKLGFPTINLAINEENSKLDYGVYIVEVYIDNGKFFGIASLGTAPTVNYNHPLLEVHIINFNQELKNALVIVNEIKKIRAIKKFQNVDELKKQISKDLEYAKKYLSIN